VDNLPDDFYSGRFMVECPNCGRIDHVTEGCSCVDSLDDCVCGDCRWEINDAGDGYVCGRCGGEPGSCDDEDACDEWADWNEEGGE